MGSGSAPSWCLAGHGGQAAEPGLSHCAAYPSLPSPHHPCQQRPSRPLEVVTTQFFSQSDAFSGCMWGGRALPELRITYRGGRGCRCCQRRGAWGWLIIRVTSSPLQPAEKLHRSPGREENRRSTEEELQPQGTNVRADRGSMRPRDGSANATCPWELRAGVWVVLHSQGRLCPRGLLWVRVGSVPEWLLDRPGVEVLCLPLRCSAYLQGSREPRSEPRGQAALQNGGAPGPVGTLKEVSAKKQL